MNSDNVGAGGEAFVKVNRYVKKNIKVENLFAYSIKNI